jgi:Spy/CpxP family protein refolding chaperone
MKRYLLAAAAVAVTLSASTSKPAPMEDINLTQGQKEQIRRIQIAEDHFESHIRARIDAVLTPKQRSLLKNHPELGEALYHN